MTDRELLTRCQDELDSAKACERRRDALPCWRVFERRRLAFAASEHVREADRWLTMYERRAGTVTGNIRRPGGLGGA